MIYLLLISLSLISLVLYFHFIKWLNKLISHNKCYEPFLIMIPILFNVTLSWERHASIRQYLRFKEDYYCMWLILIRIAMASLFRSSWFQKAIIQNTWAVCLRLLLFFTEIIYILFVFFFLKNIFILIQLNCISTIVFQIRWNTLTLSSFILHMRSYHRK